MEIKNFRSNIIYTFKIILIICISNSCEKDDILFKTNSSNSKITTSFEFNVKSESGEIINDYFVHIFVNKSDINNINPLYSIEENEEAEIPDEILSNGFWVVFKKWENAPSTVYESEPIFLKPIIPDSAIKIQCKGIENIILKERSSKCSLASIYFNVPYYKITSNGDEVPWDESYNDDAYTGSYPDVYFILDTIFTSGYYDYIDYTRESITYNFNSEIPITFPVNLTLSVYDFDFFTSPDDLMLSTSFHINNPNLDNSFQDGSYFKTYGYLSNDYYHNAELFLRFY